MDVSLNGIIEKAVAGRWIAGESIDDAISRAVKLNGINLSAIINYLGEDITDRKEISETVDIYSRVMDKISEAGLNASIAVKPTQLGLSIGLDHATRNYRLLLRKAAERKIFVWLDMESHGFLEDTVRMYLGAAGSGNAGICIQSYLRESLDEVKFLVGKKATIRLVKGAYREDAMIAYKSREEISSSYRRILDYLFLHSQRFMIATHDRGIIEYARSKKRRRLQAVSFGMLNGIMNRYAVGLAAEGENVSVYLPFGGEWVSYGYRRLREFKNSVLLARSLFEPQS